MTIHFALNNTQKMLQNIQQMFAKEGKLKVNTVINYVNFYSFIRPM